MARNWVSPDFSRYAWPGQDGIYFVTVADGSISEVGQGHSWFLLALDSVGAYASILNSSGASGLWFLPYCGTARQITAVGYWQKIGGGAAYGTGLSAAPQGADNPILRLDLKTGASTPWFMTNDGSSGQIIGFDQTGAPLITTISQYRGTMWSVPSLGGGKLIAEFNQWDNFNPNEALADAHGIWVAAQSTYLYVPNTGWFRPTAVGGSLAGGCA